MTQAQQQDAPLFDGSPISAVARGFIEAGVVRHFIDGEPTESLSGQTRPILNPSTGHQIGLVADGAATDVDRAVRYARAAFEDGRWRNLVPRERERRLHALADLIEQHASIIGDLDSINAGILRRFADYIAAYSASALHYYAGWPTKLAGALPPVGPDYHVEERFEPVGVVGVIKPWNGPAAIFAQVAPALAAGNCVVMKPAEHTPLSAAYMAQLAIEAGLPAGVFNVVHGDGIVGGALVEHPMVARLSFTGSVATGQRIAASAARTFKKVNLELGGKSPVVVFPDADLDLAAAAATRAVWTNSGQVCTAGTRTLVHRSIYDEFVSEAVRLSSDLRVGAAFDETADLGPLITEAQRQKVANYVEAGQAEGATLRMTGAAVPDHGFYQAPVIFSDVRNDMTIAREEIFGPVMSILPFDSEQEAVSLANATAYGLAAGLFTRDISRAQRLSACLEAGTVWINSYQVTDAGVSYGGTKDSGYGRSLGAAGLQEYTRRKSVWSFNY